MRPEIQALRGKFRRGVSKATPDSTINQPIQTKTAWEIAGPYTRGVAEQLQIAKTFTDGGYPHFLTGAYFPNLTDDELRLMKADALKNQAYSRLSLSIKVGDDSTRENLVDEANELSDQAEKILGKDPGNPAPPVEEIWIVSQLTGISPLLSGLSAAGSTEFLTTLFRQVSGIPTSAQLAYLNEAIRVRDGLIKEINRDEKTPLTSHFRFANTLVSALKRSQTAARKYIADVLSSNQA